MATGDGRPSGRLVRWSRAFERRIDAGIAALKRHWWIWPATLALSGAATLAVSTLFAPGPEEHVTVLGHPFGEPCGFYVTTGMPCPQCGMTRSWVWAARGALARSFFYNPAGATLFWWIVLAGVLGGLRLGTGKRDLLVVPPRLLLAWTLTWVLVLYLVPWLLRIGYGINPLPTPYFIFPHPAGDL